MRIGTARDEREPPETDSEKETRDEGVTNEHAVTINRHTLCQKIGAARVRPYSRASGWRSGWGSGAIPVASDWGRGRLGPWLTGEVSRQTTFTMMESAVGTDWGPFFSTATWLLLCMSTLSRYQPAGTAGHEPEAIPL